MCFQEIIEFVIGFSSIGPHPLKKLSQEYRISNMSDKGRSKSTGKKFKSMFYKKSLKPQKKSKLSLVFDEAARVDFVTGFHKRKLQRKTAQKLKLEKQLVAEKQRIRAEAKKSIGKKMCSSHSILPEVENLLRMTSTNFEPSESTALSYDIGSKVVTISSLDNIHMKLPPMKEEEDSDEAGAEAEGEGDPEMDSSALGGNNVKSMLKKATNRLLQTSRAYRTSQKIKQKSKKGKGRRNPNFVARRDRDKGVDPKSLKKSGGDGPGSGKRKGKNFKAPKKKGKGKS